MAVVQAIPTYFMSCFKLTESICDEINAMVKEFWWGQKGNERKICWVSWENLCKKKSEGGMGFRNLEKFNMALLVKQGWKLLRKPQSLAARILKAKYHPQLEFRKANKGRNSSYHWNSILKARGLLEKGLCWRIGASEAINV